LCKPGMLHCSLSLKMFPERIPGGKYTELCTVVKRIIRQNLAFHKRELQLKLNSLKLNNIQLKYYAGYRKFSIRICQLSMDIQYKAPQIPDRNHKSSKRLFHGNPHDTKEWRKNDASKESSSFCRLLLEGYHTTSHSLLHGAVPSVCFCSGLRCSAYLQSASDGSN
jgi:hypothetical protein